MFTSTKAAGRRSAGWLIPVLVLCIAVPSVLTMQACGKPPQQVVPQPTPTPAPATVKMTFNLVKGPHGELWVCPSPQTIYVHTGDTVVFENTSPVKVTITPDKQAFDGVSNQPFDVLADPTQAVSKTVWQGLKVGTLVTLKMDLPTGYGVEGCKLTAPSPSGPGMQVNP